MEPHTTTSGIIPADFTAFFYGIDGSVQVGAASELLSADQVGWLDRHDSKGESLVMLKAGNDGAHFVLYAAQPQHHEIVSHGPFIADSMEDIKRLYADYRAGRMQHITEVAPEQQFAY